METLLEILNDIDDTEKTIKDILDSFGVISLISELEDQFEIEIDASEIVPENFNSADAMWKMIQRLQEN